MSAVYDDPDHLKRPSARLVMISGCSGGGKSSLLDALVARGYATMAEPGRQIVREQLAIGGDALPWRDMDGFVARVIAGAMQQHEEAAATGEGTVFFDRGLVDAYAWFLRERRAVPSQVAAAVTRLRYAETVFMAPPWPEIFVTEPERRHGFAEAEAEYHGLVAAYAALGYRLELLPKTDVARRADLILASLGLAQTTSAIDSVS